MKTLKKIGSYALAFLVIPPILISCANSFVGNDIAKKEYAYGPEKPNAEWTWKYNGESKKTEQDKIAYVVIIDSAEQSVKEKTNNPDSYKAGHSAIYEDKKGAQTVCGTYRASNAFGGIVSAAYVMRPTFLIAQADAKQLKKHCNGTIVYQKG